MATDVPLSQYVGMTFDLHMSSEQNQSFRTDAAELPDEAVVFGCTPAMREIRSRIDHLPSSDLPVLIQGESGTGKEVIARYLHTRSDRYDAPFVKLNCAAVPAHLLESELFGCENLGSENGSTGTKQERPGLVDIACGGTLFLDEIGEMSWNLQGKLLRFLRDGSYTRVGGREERGGRVRVICATNVDLQRAVESGAFREDLFYRIEMVCLRLPALRDRKDDIPQLCDYFLQKLSRQFNRSAPKLSPATLHLLKLWNWPGNLRELQNWIARAIVFDGDAALSAELKRQMAARASACQRRLAPLKGAGRTETAASKAVILRVLEANRWNRRKAAEELHMTYRSLLYRLRAAGLPQRRRSHRGLPPRYYRFPDSWSS